MRKERWHTDPGPDPDNPSKSQVKRDLLDLQDFAVTLMNIPQQRLDQIDMDHRLREALADLRRLSSNARRRQVQYVAKLLRDVDLEPFRRALPPGHRARS